MLTQHNTVGFSKNTPRLSFVFMMAFLVSRSRSIWPKKSSRVKQICRSFQKIFRGCPFITQYKFGVPREKCQVAVQDQRHVKIFFRKAIHWTLEILRLHSFFQLNPKINELYNERHVRPLKNIWTEVIIGQVLSSCPVWHFWLRWLSIKFKRGPVSDFCAKCNKRLMSEIQWELPSDYRFK